MRGHDTLCLRRSQNLPPSVDATFAEEHRRSARLLDEACRALLGLQAGKSRRLDRGCDAFAIARQTEKSRHCGKGGMRIVVHVLITHKMHRERCSEPRFDMVAPVPGLLE